MNNNGRIRRSLWATAGGISLLLGIIGIPLPLLPTTPFLLLSAFCFSQSSERLHKWLTNHPTFGPPINHWHQHGAISRKAKLGAAIAMGAAIALSMALNLSFYVILAQIIVMALVCCFIFTRPNGPKKN